VPVNRRPTLGVVCVAALLLTITPVLASGPGQQFAAYEVTATLASGQHSLLVNESISPSDKAGLSVFMLQLTGSSQNLTYSRLLNSSANLLPYFPSLPSQTLDYSNGTTYSIRVNFSSSGTTDVSFQGAQYTLHIFSISVLGFYHNQSVNARGTIEAFPSSLVYSVNVSGSGNAEVQALLQATNLPLVDSSSQSMTAAYVGAGLGVGGIALAAGLLARRRERKAAAQEQKPMHWVD
jgi:phosphotransferase system  glucose/maltose/N-acetylglucosamine-specific IIC component